jgi:hypothetical protein
MMAEFMAETEFQDGVQAEVTISAGPQLRSMGLGRRTTPWALIPERSVVLVMVVKPEAFPLRDAQVLVEVSAVAGAFMVAGGMVAEGMVAEVTGNSDIAARNLANWRWNL